VDEHTEPAGGDAANRYAHLIEHIQDAVVEFELVGGEPVVRRVNEAFVDSFGYERDAVLDDPLNEWIVPEWLSEEARALDQRTTAGEINYQRVRRETAGGLREFLYRGIPYAGRDAATDGFAVYTDLTDLTRTERRLEVMNRVLQHNLRNKANIVLAYTTELLAAFDEQHARRTEAAARIEGAARDLETLTEEAADINSVLDSTADGRTTDCVPLIRDVVDEHRRNWPAATVETDLPESLVVRASRRLRFAVDALVENALEHNPSAEPRVRVRAARADSDGWTTIHVDDDGPPIPADERDVVTGDGDITATRHGSGLGLWLAKWTTELFGGELTFAASDLGGNSVRLRLPGE